jgi:hypothetical protein
MCLDGDGQIRVGEPVDACRVSKPVSNNASASDSGIEHVPPLSAPWAWADEASRPDTRPETTAAAKMRFVAYLPGCVTSITGDARALPPIPLSRPGR